MKKYKHLVFAGTFDRLHIGHKKMLAMAFSLANKVSLGITSNKMVKDKLLSQLIEKTEDRRWNLERYLKKKGCFKETRFFRIDDIYGPSTSLRQAQGKTLGIKPSIKTPPFDSILVTEFTRTNAEKINKRRKERGLPDLKIIVEPLVRGDDGEVVTSERIRMGEIDRNGHKYSILDIRYSKTGKKELTLPKYLRKEMRKPLGAVVSGSVNRLSETARKIVQSINRLDYKPTVIISVGDIVTMSLLKVGFNPDVKIVDLRSRRKEIVFRNQNFLASELASRLKTRSVTPRSSSESEGSLRRSLAQTSTRSKNFDCFNEAGTINLKATDTIEYAIKKYLKEKKKSWIIVNGEEDLLALPAILFAPLNSLVLYGQMDLGVVIVEVTEEKKKKVEEILLKFS